MDTVLLILCLQAAILGVVEGLTEFLPISSTGHLIVAGSLINFQHANAAAFDIAIQTGAIIAVIVEYRQRLINTVGGLLTETVAQRFTLNVAIAFAPAVVLGLLFGDVIEHYLFHPQSVAVAFVAGGLFILWIEARQRQRSGNDPAQADAGARITRVDDMQPLDALKVGLAQCAALIPGTSRSGATIIGGMLFGLSRRVAAEFSFYLAIPTLIGAGVWSLWKQRDSLVAADLPVFGVGLLFAFLSAWLCIRWFIRYISTHDFTLFAWYRIAFGLFILASHHFGWLVWH